MKFAIQVTELLTRTVIVEAESLCEAEQLVEDAYYNGRIQLHADNSSVDMELKDDTDSYLNMFGKDEFESMEVTEDL